jgi:uncharacterized protein YyaL (SSP411 family)
MTDLINWRTDLASAREEAKTANKPLLLEIYLDTCSHCARLHKETHQDPEVAAAVNEGFIPVRLEGRGNMDIVRQYGVTGAPTTLIFTPDGQEKHRFMGFYTAAEFRQELAKGA